MDSKRSRYKRAVPRAFSLPFPSKDDSVDWTCFTYTIRFQNIKPGTDPMQRSASDFLLLSPQLLDEEVASISVHLNLTAFSSVESKLAYCGVLHISQENVEFVKKFNIWLFHLALGKCFAVPKVSGEGTKNYYILPCKPIVNDVVPSPEQLIDWQQMEVAVKSGLLYRSKVHFFGGYATLDPQDIRCDRVLEAGELRMQNGIFREHELEDALVTCANNGLPCYIYGVLHDISGNSLCPQPAGRIPMTYSEYHVQKCKYKLEYPNQPLLKGYRIVRAGNYLRRIELERPAETMELPPEMCTLHAGLKGSLVRGAMRLPSFLHSLEMSLVAAELRNKIGPPISCFKVQEALTSGACEGNNSYETMELLGDSVLNFVGGVHMYIDFASCNSETLHTYRHDLVSNKSLYRCGLACGLPEHIFAELLNTKTWVPPGPALEDLPPKPPASDESSENMDGQVIGLKTLADVVEALIGVYFLNGGMDSALKAMNWLQVPIPFPEKVPEVVYTNVEEKMRPKSSFNDHDIATLEKKIAYHFRCKSLLVSAFDFGDEVTFNDAGAARGSFEFQRLEFLGDSVLDFLIMRHFVQLYPGFNPEQLNNLRQATVNSENYACVAISHGLHHYLQKLSPILQEQIKVYAAAVLREGRSPFGIPSRTSPKAIGDLLQTLAGSVLLDSNFDYDLVWKVLKPLLSPLATPETVMRHPRRLLELFCRKQELQLELRTIKLEETMEARVYISQMCVASSQHSDSTIARRLAAFTALRSLSQKPSGLKLYGPMENRLNDGILTEITMLGPWRALECLEQVQGFRMTRLQSAFKRVSLRKLALKSRFHQSWCIQIFGFSNPAVVDLACWMWEKLKTKPISSTGRISEEAQGGD